MGRGLSWCHLFQVLCCFMAALHLQVFISVDLMSPATAFFFGIIACRFLKF